MATLALPYLMVIEAKVESCKGHRLGLSNLQLAHGWLRLLIKRRKKTQSTEARSDLWAMAVIGGT